MERSSLPEQTAGFLRQQLREGVYREVLPSESTLSKRLGVSRSTLRRALAMLEADGTVSSGQGRRRKISEQAVSDRERSQVRTVAFLVPDELENLGTSVIEQVSKVRRILAKNRINVETVTSSAHQRRDPAATLKRMVERIQADGWILHLSSPAMQQWFLDHGLRFVVNGSAIDDRRVACVDLDWQAIGRHVMQVLARAGHRQVGCLVRKAGGVGTAKFLSGIDEATTINPDLSCERVECGSEPGDPVVAVTRLLKSTAAMPTAWIVQRFADVLELTIELQGRGIGIPSGISLVCVEYDPYAHRMKPVIAHYLRDYEQHSKRLARLMMQVINDNAPPEPTLVSLPDFIAGGSIGPPAVRK